MVNVGNRMIQLLTGGDPTAREKAAEAAAMKTLFQDLVDDLFSETGKRIDRQSNELRFFQYDETISPYLLSSGEKQMLIILLTVLTEDLQPYVQPSPTSVSSSGKTLCRQLPTAPAGPSTAL